MAHKTALLVQVPALFLTGLVGLLKEKDYQLIIVNDVSPELSLGPEDTLLNTDTRGLQTWLEDHDLAIDCWITAASITLEMPSARPVTYPPYPLYEHILTRMQQHHHGRVVNLYHGPGSAQGLSMHQINTIAARNQSLMQGQDILFNSVNIEPLSGLTQDQERSIHDQRLETILWLATTEDSRPHLEFFRGYDTSV
jgi:hypothetical protein